MKTRRFSMVAATLASLTVSAFAQPAPSPVDPKVEAKAKYEKGLNHYNLGEFDQAIAEFKVAYSLTSAPGLLFNIAQSYRLKKDYEQAGLFYRNYLRLKPDAGNRADVEERIKEMDKNIDDQKAIGLSPPRGTLPPEGDNAKPAVEPSAVVVSAPPIKDKIEAPRMIDYSEAQSGRTLQLAGLATAGAGAALVITGVVFGGMAASAESELDALSANMGVWSTAEQDRYDAGSRNNTIAIISYVAGGAALVTGGTLWYLGRMKVKSSIVAVVPGRTGTTVTVGWSF